MFLDGTLSFDKHISHLRKVLYLQLRCFSQIRPYLSVAAAKKFAVAFILSRLDYCNALMAGLPDCKISKLQHIQNCAARLVLRKSKHDHATPLLRELHWLPIRARIDYKIAVLCYQCLNVDAMPTYLCDLLAPYAPARTLRSSGTSLLAQPRFSLCTFGNRAFSVYGPRTWNSLPLSLRQATTLASFKSGLKTHLFLKHFETQ